MRFGALRAGWGELRRHRLERSLADLDVIQTGEELINECAQLRAEASRIGHPLSQKIHEADRWVATTAVVLGLELGDQPWRAPSVPIAELSKQREYEIRTAALEVEGEPEVVIWWLHDYATGDVDLIAVASGHASR